MQLMISGGGTGGHVYPALAVVQTLNPDTRLIWVGSETGMEKELVERANIPYTGISAAGLRGKSLPAMLTGVVALAKGYRQSQKLITHYQPEVVFVTGGYVCVPITLAAHRSGIPVMIYLPDIQPGQAIKYLSRYATRVAVTAPAAQAYFPPGLAVVTGYPVRADLFTANPVQSRADLGLHPTRPTLLVFGGSQGAHSLNQAIANPQALGQLLAATQIIHVSGNRDVDWVTQLKNALPAEQQQYYHIYPYLHTEMTAAFAAADLVICRAGASVLGELPAAGKPAILVPYPYSGVHQLPNARYLADQGAAQIITDADLPQTLVPMVLNLINNSTQLAKMAHAARCLARPQAAQAIASQLQEVRHDRRIEH